MPLPRSIHKLVSPVMYQSGLYRRFWRARHRRDPFSFVVFYHRVVADGENSPSSFSIEKGISASAFESQMRFLCRHFVPVRASRIQHCADDRIGFAVTLDDGYEDNFRIAAPILKKLGIPATFYVVSDFVGTDRLFWWEQIAELMRESDRAVLDMQAVFPGLSQAEKQTGQLPMGNPEELARAYEMICACIRNGRHVDIPAHINRVSDYFGIPVREHGRRYGMMNWQQLNELVGQGFEIGGHTATHCNVVGAAEPLLRTELLDSARAIEEKISAPVESFAYPYGVFEASSDAVADLLAKTNCKAAFTTEHGVIHSGTHAGKLPRITLNRPYHFACAFNLQDALITGSGRDRQNDFMRGSVGA